VCKIYLASDPIQYESRSRTLRIHGVATTIRLEKTFWDVLQRIAESEGKTTNQLITQFYDEAVYDTPDEAPKNFASVLRVTCCRYLEINSTRETNGTSTGRSREGQAATQGKVVELVQPR
jgi:predicted DNA-binding ribbon-helix-helix protein